jgi:hypothetical protein
MPKLPLMVPRASTEPTMRSEWSGQDSLGPQASPRSHNPSRSPRPETPTHVTRGLRPVDDVSDAPPRPPKHPDLDSRKQRARVCEEIVSSEEVYVNTLQTIVDVYRRPLVEEGVLAEEACVAVFLNTSQLLERHSALLASLKAMQNFEELGTVLSNGLLPNLSLYKTYISQFNKAGDTLKCLMEERKFCKVLAELSHTPEARERSLV